MIQLLQSKNAELQENSFLTACRAAGLNYPCSNMCKGCGLRKEKMKNETAVNDKKQAEKELVNAIKLCS